MFQSCLCCNKIIPQRTAGLRGKFLDLSEKFNRGRCKDRLKFLFAAERFLFKKIPGPPE